ncbi:MAG: hypothetical protein HRT37_25280 [Alteromonadaceae bacterium]|nr:hypothetical protein [Alteromonadaceae bacterium]
MNILSQKIFQGLVVLVVLVTTSLTAASADDGEIAVDFKGYSAASGIRVSYNEQLLTAEWDSGDKVISASFRVVYRDYTKSKHPQRPLIQSISVRENDKSVEVFKDLQPEYAIFLGKRDLKKRDGTLILKKGEKAQVKLDLDIKGSTWVRFEVWDIAKNGTFTQPIWLSTGRAG